MIILIAGPQSSGKTTLFNHLKNFYYQAIFQPEINPYTFSANHSGGAFTSGELQKQISLATIHQFKKLVIKSKTTLIFWETGFMNLAYIKKDLPTNDYFYFKNLYLKLLKTAEVKLLFIETQPRVSWQRRKDTYFKRVKQYLKDNQIIDEVKQEEITKIRMSKYKNNIWLMYPLFKETIKVLNLPTYFLKNNTNSLEKFLEKSRSLVATIISNAE